MSEETTSLKQEGGMSSESMESISGRLSELENLYFPRAAQSSSAPLNPPLRKSLLLHLLSRDVPLFLERYGSQLTFEELKEFDILKEDYEVNWHLNHLRSLISPTDEDLRSRSVKVKNRRRAYLDKLMYEGQYFSEDAMREREPYLHHEYVGQYQDPSGRRMARPGERWSETLLRRAEEGILVAKIRREQQRLGVAQKDWVGNDEMQMQEEEQQEEEEEEEQEEEEEESDDEEEKVSENVEMQTEEEEEEVKGIKEEEEKGRPRDGETNVSLHQSEVPSRNHDVLNNAQSTTERPDGGVNLSEEEMQDRMDQFTHIMQQKFMSGEDHQHLDYSKIDEDETLDDHWTREENQDAEEKYFDDV